MGGEDKRSISELNPDERVVQDVDKVVAFILGGTGLSLGMIGVALKAAKHGKSSRNVQA